MNPITVRTLIGRPVDKVWGAWTMAEHITQWNFASDEWHCPSANNDLRPGGRFSWRMEARDGSMGFDFCGTYDLVEQRKRIAGKLDDGREVAVHFEADGEQTRVTETFEAEESNPVEMQKAGWQAILENFRKHVESLD